MASFLFSGARRNNSNFNVDISKAQQHLRSQQELEKQELEKQEQKQVDSPTEFDHSLGDSDGRVNVIRGRRARLLKSSIVNSFLGANGFGGHDINDGDGGVNDDYYYDDNGYDDDDNFEDSIDEEGRRKRENWKRAAAEIKARGKRNDSRSSDDSSRNSRRSSTIVMAFEQSAFGKFMNCEDMSPDELDDGVNQMALVCAVILTIPYQVGQSVGHEYFDWLKVELSKCDRGATGGYDLGDSLAAFREYMLCCMYSTMCGMILSTFYFLFKRSKPKEVSKYMRKCRYITIFIFICCTFAILSLMALSNYLLSWFVLHTGGICEQTTFMQWYMFAALFFSLVALVVSIYLVW